MHKKPAQVEEYDSEDNLEVPDDDFDQGEGEVKRFRLWSFKKNRFVKDTDKITMTIDQLQIVGGNVHILAKMI